MPIRKILSKYGLDKTTVPYFEIDGMRAVSVDMDVMSKGRDELAAVRLPGDEKWSLP